MTARLTHKRGSTLRWTCRRMSDPPPGSGVEPEPISVEDWSVAVAIRNDTLGFSVSLEVLEHESLLPEDGWFEVYCPSEAQRDWPLGDHYFDVVFTRPSQTLGQPDDVDQTQTGVIHIQKEQTLWL